MQSDPPRPQYRTRGYTRDMRDMPVQSRVRSRGNAARNTALCAVIAMIGPVAALAGCASHPSGPSYLSVPRAQYAQVFDAACDAARAEGLTPELADRQSGVIGTQPRAAGSLIEPWTWQDLTASDVVEATFGFERRRAYFEFVPAGFRPIAPEGSAPLAGPVLPGSEREVPAGVGEARGGDAAVGPAVGPGAGEGAAASGTDALDADASGRAARIEVRVSVSVERQFRPGYQGTAYTRALGSYARDLPPKRGRDERPASQDRSTWTPVARDERLERVLIERIAERLAPSAP